MFKKLSQKCEGNLFLRVQNSECFLIIQHFINSKFLENEQVNDSSCQPTCADYKTGNALGGETLTSGGYDPVVKSHHNDIMLLIS